MGPINRAGSRAIMRVFLKMSPRKRHVYTHVQMLSRAMLFLYLTLSFLVDDAVQGVAVGSSSTSSASDHPVLFGTGVPALRILFPPDGFTFHTAPPPMQAASSESATASEASALHGGVNVTISIVV